jgi:acyl-homoserine-lactone acylase
MRRITLVLAAVAVVLASPSAQVRDQAAWARQAQDVTIIRDSWGVPHVYGRTDADTVFGVVYAQAEDDFNRVETNYLNSLGRLAEAEGESAVYRDLRMKLFIDPADLKLQYGRAPTWLRALMDAWADGLNYFLATHPAVKPRVITRFEPWMALSFSEGSIGGDIETINLGQLGAFYGSTSAGTDAQRAAGGARSESPAPEDDEPRGSNGAAISPDSTVDHHALLLINPHTSFFFRAEAQMVSDEGLNAYGAITWGQFFIYQGFNDRAGWMHTSSSVDAVDEYLETIVRRGGRYFYRYGSEERPVTVQTIRVPYRTSAGLASKDFTVYRTHHGPIVRQANDRWVAVRLMQDPLKALTQSFSRTKARNYKAFLETMQLHTNSSNNTIYADADGTIAYLHANFIPRRETRFDWTKPVDGSDPATEWGGPLSVDESPKVLNPASGWLYNSNDVPWRAAGPNSPKQSDFPAYVDSGSENPRGIHAIRVLENRKDFTLDRLVAAAFDSYLPAFAAQVPALVAAWDRLSAGDPLKAKVGEPIALLRAWDCRWAVDSVATTLAVYWGEESGRRGGAGGQGRRAAPAGSPSAPPASADPLVLALAAVVDRLTADFGSWKTPWGEVNRYQRLTGDIVQTFTDAGRSIPVGFTSARWGSLASFGARTYPGTRRMYGTSGNSFVAVVEFGERVRAKAVSAGGQSGDPASKHFGDQAERYATGRLRDVYFDRADVERHAERTYRPGQR